MTHFNGLLLGTELLFIPLAITVYVAVTADTMRRFIAMQLAGVLGTVILALLSTVFGQPQFFELALAGALLSIGGAFVYSHFLERWF
jgi:multisubunit Na+/H+ antiporter MnhF subunit